MPFNLFKSKSDTIRIGVVGSRRRNSLEDFDLLRKAIESKIDKYGYGNIQLVSGGCQEGADRFAEVIHEDCKLPLPMIIHYPDRTKLNPNLPPKIAWADINYARNTLIAQDSDILLAMVTEDRKGGTEDTIKKFRRAKRKEPELL